MDDGKEDDLKLDYKLETYDEDDKHTIQIFDPSSIQKNISSSPTNRKINLDLSLAMAESKYKNHHDTFDGEQESSKSVVFNFSDGSQGKGYFKLGQTVEFLKSFVELEYGIPMNAQTFYLENNVMMDPLSLLDFPETKGSDEIYIRVNESNPKDHKN